MTDATTARQIRFTRRSPAYWRVTFDHHVNRSFPDAELGSFVDSLATRISSFDKHAIAETKRLVNINSLPARRRDVETRLGYHVGLLGGNDPRNK